MTLFFILYGIGSLISIFFFIVLLSADVYDQDHVFGMILVGWWLWPLWWFVNLAIWVGRKYR